MELEMHISLESTLDLNKLDLPPVPKVDAIEWQPIVDHVGDDAYEITIIIPDDTPEPDRKRRLTRAIENQVREVLRNAGISEFAYTRTLTRKDLREAEKDAAAEAAEEDELREKQER